MVTYPLAMSSWDEDEYRALDRVIASGNFTMGPEVRAFEEEFARWHGARYALMVNSGSSANLVLMAGLRHHARWSDRVGEVIVPAVSWGTTFYPVVQAGWRLRFVDVDPGDWNLDVSAVSEAIGPETVGIFGVNLLGASQDFVALRALAEENDLFYVEDNCESLGSERDGIKAGVGAMAGTHSGFFSHHISTMEGGVVVTDDRHLYELMYSLRAHGWVRGLPPDNTVHPLSGDPFEDSFKFVLPGYNLRPLEMSGALGCAQMRKLPAMLSARRRNAAKFLEAVEEFPWLRAQSPVGESSWFGFGIVLDPDGPITREKLTARFRQQGIECRPVVAGNFTRNPVMKHLDHAPLGELSVADELHDHGLFFGNHHFNLDAQLESLNEELRRV